MEYLSVANNPILYIITIVLLVIVFAQALVFFRLAMKRAKEINLPKEKLIIASKTAAITTIIPSIATVIAFISLVPVLGIAFSWARLSVIGSLSYELMAAEVGAAAAGTSLNSPNYDGSAFIASVVAMTMGSAPTLFITALFYKKFKAGVNKSIEKKGDKVFTGIMLATLTLGLYTPFVLGPALSGGVNLIVLGSSGVAMIIVTFLIKKFNIRWLNDFSLSIAMFAGMFAAVIGSL